MQKEKKKIKSSYFRFGLTAFIVVAACVLLYFCVLRISGIFSFLNKVFAVLEPVIIGFVIAYLVNPISNAVENLLKKLVDKKIKDNKTGWYKACNAVGVIIALLTFTVIIFLIVYLIVPQFVTSVSNVIDTVPGQIDKLIKWTNSMLTKSTTVKKTLISVLNYEKKWLQTDFTKYVAKYATNVANGVWSVVKFLKNFLIGLMVALYMLFNKRLLVRQIKKLMFTCMNSKTVENVLSVGNKSNEIFSGFIYGKLLDSLIIGVLCFIGTTILNIPYPVLVSVIVGVTNIIPVFGPYIGAIPCAALIVLSNPIKGIYFIIFIILLQALDGNFIGPKILGDSTGLSAFWVVLAIILGGGMFGILGMLIGVPAFALIYYLFTSYFNAKAKAKNLPLESEFYDGDVCEKLKGIEIQETEIPLDKEE